MTNEERTGRPEPEAQESEIKQWEKLWGACASEDGFVVAVDPAGLKSFCRMGRERATEQPGASTGQAIDIGVYQSACSPGANVMAASYRVNMLGFCELMGLLPGCKRDGDYTDAVFQVAATFPMKLMEVGVTYDGPPFDVEEFMKRVERARPE